MGIYLLELSNLALSGELFLVNFLLFLLVIVKKLQEQPQMNNTSASGCIKKCQLTNTHIKDISFPNYPLLETIDVWGGKATKTRSWSNTKNNIYVWYRSYVYLGEQPRSLFFLCSVTECPPRQSKSKLHIFDMEMWYNNIICAS